MTLLPAIRLQQLQTWFASVSTHSGGVDAGALEANRALGLPDDDGVDRLVTAGPMLSAAERLQIYNDGYFARLIECLADDYPGLAYALGEDVFSSLAREYIEQKPSRSPSLNAYGGGMPAFCQGRPEPWAAFASDLSRLEWALVEAVHAPAASAIAPDALSSIPTSRWQSARLVPSLTLRVLRFDYPVGEYFQAFRDGRAPVLPEPRVSATAVYRHGLALWRMDLAATAALLLQDLVAGVPLASAVSALERRTRDPAAREELVQALPRWLGTWVSSGFFVAIELG
jgi:hypothetical protein